MTRRDWLAGAAAIAARAQSSALYAYVGCYTTAQRYARGDGIHVYRVDATSGGGPIKLRFALTETEVITEIEDSGHGIAPEVLDHLFEAFVTFGKPRGTGLGLSITQKIIEEHHGKISARNRPGGGAIFSFTLPRSDANLAA